MSSVEMRNYGVASGTLGTMWIVSQMLSMGIAMMTLSILVGNVAIIPDQFPQLLASMRIVFLVSSVLCITGIFFSLVRGNIRPEECRSA